MWPVLEVPADMDRLRALNSEQSRGENQAAGREKLGAMACNVYTGQWTPASLSESDEFFSSHFQLFHVRHCPLFDLTLARHSLQACLPNSLVNSHGFLLLKIPN